MAKVESRIAKKVELGGERKMWGERWRRVAMKLKPFDRREWVALMSLMVVVDWFDGGGVWEGMVVERTMASRVIAIAM